MVVVLAPVISMVVASVVAPLRYTTSVMRCGAPRAITFQQFFHGDRVTTVLII
jgi:hypothetical protein